MRTVPCLGRVDKAVGNGMIHSVIPIAMPYAKVRNLKIYLEIKVSLYKCVVPVATVAFI